MLIFERRCNLKKVAGIIYVSKAGRQKKPQSLERGLIYSFILIIKSQKQTILFRSFPPKTMCSD